MAEVKVGEYNGYPTISLPLNEEGKYPFTFGVAKAIVEHIEDIKKFVNDNSKSKEDKENVEELNVEE